MSQNNYIIEPLDKSHNRSCFSCGIDTLDNYLEKQAAQEIRKHISVTYVINDIISRRIAGYYNLSSFSIELSDIPEHINKKLPKYPKIATTLIGRLAVDKKYQNKKLGEALLVDALYRSYESQKVIGSFAVVVDAINNDAVSFYKKYGFLQLDSSERKLFLPMKTIESLSNGIIK
jgi:ribosomal protein S18 acetylase RimI-like enzyme